MVGIDDGDPFSKARTGTIFSAMNGAFVVRQRGRHQHDLGAGKRQRRAAFRELHVVADEQAGLEPTEFDRRAGGRSPGVNSAFS